MARVSVLVFFMDLLTSVAGTGGAAFGGTFVSFALVDAVIEGLTGTGFLVDSPTTVFEVESVWLPHLNEASLRHQSPVETQPV